MVDAAAGNQQDLLVVESSKRAFQGRRGEDALVAGLQEGVALGVDGLQSEFTDLVAREGALNLLLAHVDGAVTVVVRLARGSRVLGGGGLVRAYSTSVSEAVARAPIAYLVGRDVLETSLSPADAGRIEAELRGRGATILDTIWGTDVTVRVAIDPTARESIDACLAQASSGVAKFRYVETRRIELDEAPSAG